MTIQNLLNTINSGSKNNSNMQEISVYFCYLGSDISEYFKKEKDEYGKTLKVNGKEVRSSESSGYSYKGSTIGNTVKVVNFIHKSKLNLEFGKVYLVEGLGYDIKSSNFIFIEETKLVKAVEM